MNTTARISSPYLDESWRRLIWIAPLSMLVWAALLFGFSLLLTETEAPPPELKPIEARIVELPPAGGLQGGAAPVSHPVLPKPHPEIVRKLVPVFRPRTEIHQREKVKPIVPPAPASPNGTSKTGAQAPFNPAASSSSTGNNTEGGGVPGGKGSGSGAGLGSDSTGARAIYAPVPKIPDDLREDTFESVAVAHFKVTYDGRVEIALVQPTSNPRLNEILIDTLKQWRFFPAMKKGVAIDSEFDVRIPIAVQ
jgi:periplasmic protein TonB